MMMKTTEILNTMETFLDKEYRDAKRAIEMHPFLFKPKEVVNNSLQRGLGIALFVQELGCDFPSVNERYEPFKEKMEELRG